MKVATHIFSGHITEEIGDDTGRPPITVFPLVAGAEIELSADLTRPLIDWLDQPGNSWLKQATPDASARGIVLAHELTGRGFDGVYETSNGRLYANCIWSIQECQDFVAEAGADPAVAGLCAVLRDTLAAWAKLPTPPTHVIIDHPEY